jgi:hypothetical protein
MHKLKKTTLNVGEHLLIGRWSDATRITTPAGPTKI